MSYKLLFIGLLGVLVGCQEEDGYQQYYGQAQGTTFSIIYEGGKLFESEIDSVLHLMDQEFSTYDENSRISTFNRSKKGVEVSDLFADLWEKCWEINILSDGLFDPTLKPVFDLYKFGESGPLDLDSHLVAEALSHTGMHLVSIRNDSLCKQDEMVQLDLNGIAQGYSVDVLCSFLELNNISNYMVEIGGEVRAKGVNKSNKTWTIGIEKPVNSGQRNLSAKIQLDNKSVATSGNYRKNRMVNGKETGHILNPKTGFMKSSVVLSASVIAPDCFKADALATSFMNMDLEEIMRLDGQHENFGVLVIYAQGIDTLLYLSNQYKDEMLP